MDILLPLILPSNTLTVPTWLSHNTFLTESATVDDASQTIRSDVTAIKDEMIFSNWIPYRRGINDKPRAEIINWLEKHRKKLKLHENWGWWVNKDEWVEARNVQKALLESRRVKDEPSDLLPIGKLILYLQQHSPVPASDLDASITPPAPSVSLAYCRRGASRGRTLASNCESKSAGGERTGLSDLV